MRHIKIISKYVIILFTVVTAAEAGTRYSAPNVPRTIKTYPIIITILKHRKFSVLFCVTRVQRALAYHHL